MSQKFRIDSYKILPPSRGKLRAPRNIDIETGEITELLTGEKVAAWLCDAWRFRFNIQRQQRQAGNRDMVLPSTSQLRKEHPFLAGVPEYVLHAPVKEEATDFFASTQRAKTLRSKGRYGGSFSRRFKSRRDHKGFTVLHNGGRGTDGVHKLNRNKSQVIIKGNGWRLAVRFKHSHNDIVHEYSSAKIDMLNGHIVFVNPPRPIEKPKRDRRKKPKAVGIDVGVKQTLAMSDGTFSNIPKPTAAETKAHKLAQRSMSRKDSLSGQRRSSSKNRARAKAEVAKRSAKQARRRKDWIEKETTRLVSEFDVIAIENLNIVGMSKSASGKGRAAKAGLNRSILSSCWGQFRKRLEDKAKLAGVEVIAVNPANTSRQCFSCKHTAQSNRESQAVFECTKCGHEDNADTNAAKNILGLAVASTKTGVGTRPQGESRKRNTKANRSTPSASRKYQTKGRQVDRSHSASTRSKPQSIAPSA